MRRRMLIGSTVLCVLLMMEGSALKAARSAQNVNPNPGLIACGTTLLFFGGDGHCTKSAIGGELRMGNRWTFSSGLTLGISYLGIQVFDSYTALVLFGPELGWRF